MIEKCPICGRWIDCGTKCPCGRFTSTHRGHDITDYLDDEDTVVDVYDKRKPKTAAEPVPKPTRARKPKPKPKPKRKRKAIKLNGGIVLLVIITSILIILVATVVSLLV